jgi:hydroxyacylglutathione hydrolase
MQAHEGKAEEVAGPPGPDGAPGRLRRLVAPNPSPMTGAGTNTWLLGMGEVTLVDPGPGGRPGEVHLRAILGALGPGEVITRILVSHAHHDHSGLAPALAAATRAPVMACLPADGWPQGAGGEGIDRGFAPGSVLADGDVFDVAGLPLSVIHTPGHLGDHACFLWGDAEGRLVLTGDHVMGWSTSLIAPPEGDMGAYLRALSRLAAALAAEDPARPVPACPGHGAVVPDAAARIAALLAHRRQREAEILLALRTAPGATTIPAIAARVYPDLAVTLHPAAELNILAHLIDLQERNLAIVDCSDGRTATTASRFRAT